MVGEKGRAALAYIRYTLAMRAHDCQEGLAERTTSLDGQRVRLPGLEVPEAQASTTVPAPPDPEARDGCR